MIGKRNGHHATARQPAFDLAQDDSVRERFGRRRGWVNDGSISVSLTDGRVPRHGMKNRRRFVTTDKLSPSRVAKRIKGINRQNSLRATEPRCRGQLRVRGWNLSQSNASSQDRFVVASRNETGSAHVPR